MSTYLTTLAKDRVTDRQRGIYSVCSAVNGAPPVYIIGTEAPRPGGSCRGQKRGCESYALAPLLEH